MEDNILVYTIGVGAGFPIQLSESVDKDGAVMLDPDTHNPLITWGLTRGHPDLILQNVASTLATPLGSFLRDDPFGSRLWELIEEPNTQAVKFLAKQYITDAIKAWEPRVNVNVNRISVSGSKLRIGLKMSIRGTDLVTDLNFDYNPTNNSVDYGN